MSRFRLRDYAPRGLYARLANLVAVPVLAIFAITTLYYYQEHIARVNDKLSQSIAREVALIADLCEDPVFDAGRQRQLERQLGLLIECEYAGGKTWSDDARTRFGYASILRDQMASVTDRQIEVRTIDRASVLDFRAPVDNGTVRVMIDRKRALAANTHFTIVWVLLGALFMLTLAFAFLRNQVRSILQLTEAAKAFGRGRDLPDYRPSGATEIRDAARAMMEMRARLTAFADQRTSMLAGVSHDLRTPLTRLKLQLAMLPPSNDVELARADLDQMSQMLNEYLAFASGEEGEAPEKTRLDKVATQLINRFEGAVLNPPPVVTVPVRPMSLNRALSNLIGNALQYGGHCEVTLVEGPRWAEFLIDDDGPGIPEDQRDDAFRPFHRLDDARSQNTPGTGLGLTLVRDFAHAHGGDIRLEDSPLGGLRVRLRLPY
ncbi:MAG: ATP-binding protein [Pseudomonadota bacterium]